MSHFGWTRLCNNKVFLEQLLLDGAICSQASRIIVLNKAMNYHYQNEYYFLLSSDNDTKNVQGGQLQEHFSISQTAQRNWPDIHIR